MGGCLAGCFALTSTQAKAEEANQEQQQDYNSMNPTTNKSRISSGSTVGNGAAPVGSDNAAAIVEGGGGAPATAMPTASTTKTTSKWNSDWDKRSQQPSAPARTSRYLVLVRHGQYEHRSGALTTLGRQQARILGRRLARLPYTFDQVHVSDVLRARETCDIVMEELRQEEETEGRGSYNSNKKNDNNNHNNNNNKNDDNNNNNNNNNNGDGWNNGSNYDTESEAEEEKESTHCHHKQQVQQEPLVTNLLAEGAPCPPEPPHATWAPEPAEFFADGARIEAGFRKFFYRPKNDQQDTTHELLVCHGNVIRYCTLRALQLPPEAWLRLSHANCAMTVVRISAGGHCSLESFGDAGHLEGENRTFN